MKSLFDEIILGKINVKNRLIRSATFEYGYHTEGYYLHNIYDIYENLAKGGIGLIITGMVGIDENSRINPYMIKAYDDLFPKHIRQLIDLVHQYNCKAVIQIAHNGAKVPKTDTGLPPLAPSQIPEKEFREMSLEDIHAVIEQFALTATRCKEAGADGIQIHAAHGYLISQFLSPLFNRRNDAYGGGIERRAKLLFDIYKSIRTAVGNNYPIWVKINSSDLSEGGLTFAECQWICQQLSRLGVDAIEVSGGISLSPANTSAQPVRKGADEGNFFAEAMQIAEVNETDVISVCGHRTPEILEEKLNRSKVMAFSLSRPLICEPALANRWHSGDFTKAKCISCNKCFVPGELKCRIFPQQ